jgi:pyoverdine/dityrosine biosynthesis protein Dit1
VRGIAGSCLSHVGGFSCCKKTNYGDNKYEKYCDSGYSHFFLSIVVRNWRSDVIADLAITAFLANDNILNEYKQSCRVWR